MEKTNINFSGDSEILVSIINNISIGIFAFDLKGNITIANKETLVVGGEIIMPLVKQYGVDLINKQKSDFSIALKLLLNV